MWVSLIVAKPLRLGFASVRSSAQNGNLLNTTPEPNALLRAVRATVAPRLVQEDAQPFDELLRAAFREDALVKDDGSIATGRYGCFDRCYFY